MNLKEQLNNLAQKFAIGGETNVGPGFGKKIVKKYIDVNDKEVVQFEDGSWLHTDSDEYIKLHNEGLLYGESPNKVTYPQDNANPELERYKRIESENPYSEFVKPYFEGVSGSIARGLSQSDQDLGNTPEDYKKRYDENISQKWAQEIFDKNPQNEDETRGDYLNRITSDMNPEIVKSLYENLPKGEEETYWQGAGRGLENIVESQFGVGSQEERINSNKNLSDYEKSNLTNESKESPYLSNISTNLKVLEPLIVPAKAVQSIYRPEYTLDDAMSGKKNTASIGEDMATDPLNLLGLSMFNKGSNVGKLSEVASNANKFRNESKNLRNFFTKEKKFYNISEGDIENAVNRTKKAINSPNYKARRSATTGESEKQIEEQIRLYEEINKKSKKVMGTDAFLTFKDRIPKYVDGYYQHGDHKIVISNKLDKEEALNTLDHEVKHLFSPTGKEGGEELYKNYPTLELSKNADDYALDPVEQQVRFFRMNDKIRQDLKLPDFNFEPLSKEHFSKWLDDFNLPSLGRGYSDVEPQFADSVIHMRDKGFSSEAIKNNLLDNLNKAWVAAPIGLGAAYQFGNQVEEPTEVKQKGGSVSSYKEQLNNLAQKFQKGGQKPYSEKHYDEKDIKQYYNTVLNSDWYRDRLIKNDYDRQYKIGVDKVIENRLNRVNSAYLRNVQKDDGVLNQLTNFFTSGELVPSGMGSYYNQDTAGITLIKSQLDKHKAHPRSVLTHEFGHAEVDGGISKTETNLLKEYLPTTKDKHDQSPIENKSDLNSIRYNLYKEGKFDPKTGKYKTKDGLFNKSLIPSIQEDATLKRSRRIYGDDKMVELLNTIADNSDRKTTMAQKGGTIRNQLNILANKYSTL